MASAPAAILWGFPNLWIHPLTCCRHPSFNNPFPTILSPPPPNFEGTWAHFKVGDVVVVVVIGPIINGQVLIPFRVQQPWTRARFCFLVVDVVGFCKKILLRILLEKRRQIGEQCQQQQQRREGGYSCWIWRHSQSSSDENMEDSGSSNGGCG